ncbi:MAG: hypothetical protein AAF066_13570 [Pseudomonadota bacterium]
MLKCGSAGERAASALARGVGFHPPYGPDHGLRLHPCSGIEPEQKQAIVSCTQERA